MNLNLLTPGKALNKAFLKKEPPRDDIEGILGIGYLINHAGQLLTK
jgi:hypothetical protein